MDSERELEGAAVLSIMWYEVAKRVVEKAIEVYETTPEQSAALRTAFTQFRDYGVQES